MDEFELIRTLWQNPSNSRTDVVVGIGDDAAIIDPPANTHLVITTDACIEGVHFHAHSEPKVIARRAFMRTLSDLAAMGATPAWFTLNLTTPTNDLVWLQSFRDELLQLAYQVGAQLIGGDTTQGSLAMHLMACGYLPKNTGLLRSKAKVGDLIVVSGTLGGASAALNNPSPELQRYYDAPTARLQLGQDLLSIANACIDISDGLTQDLNHILTASQVGATLQLAAIPCASQATLQNALSGGDDYELCFTVDPGKQNQLSRLANKHTLPLTIIGTIESTPGLRAQDAAGQIKAISIDGYQHFREQAKHE